MDCFTKKTKKRVRFDEKPQIKFMFVWNFAHREARTNKWQQYGRDRVRFERRIDDIEYKIEHVFYAEHRKKIYNARFNN